MKPVTNRRNCLLCLGSALVATACVSTRLDPGTDHPANAKAETAPPPATDTILASAPATRPADVEPAAHAHDHAAPMADTYTCPMHPQIVKNAPGKCPICGMNLVKKGSATPEKAAP